MLGGAVASLKGPHAIRATVSILWFGVCVLMPSLFDIIRLLPERERERERDIYIYIYIMAHRPNSQ